MDAARLKRIAEGAAQMGLQLGPEQLKLLGRHVDLLLKWNKSINLTAITDPDEVVEKHVLDSLAVVPVLPSGSLLDAGTGGGFPGIPIAIAKPELEVTLVDSVQKKVAFLKSALAELRLPKVRAYAARLEGNPSREDLPRVHAAVARAFAPPAQWLPLAEQYVLPGGVAICMLGPGDEVPERVGDLALQEQLSYELPYSASRRRLAIYKRV
ncbi:MAG TPA: 16S rRNA (guanine(527)-N(7))-methyltransferase RsmG [Myxococcales bacterium]|nr:16S rRNA (guanine(527)-N(7))-methyltransferase RsmG [Myxococcales bacterium]